MDNIIYELYIHDKKRNIKFKHGQFRVYAGAGNMQL